MSKQASKQGLMDHGLDGWNVTRGERRKRESKAKDRPREGWIVEMPGRVRARRGAVCQDREVCYEGGRIWVPLHSPMYYKAHTG
jgi:hypothetical protein